MQPVKIPKYQMIKRHYQSRIESGELNPNDRIPSEKALATELGVSPLTVARALSELEDEGYVIRRVGDGTYVRQREGAESPLFEGRSKVPGQKGTEVYLAILCNNMAFGFVPHMIHRIEERLSHLGFHIVIKGLKDDFEEAMKAAMFFGGQPDVSALLYCPITSLLFETENKEVLSVLRKFNKPSLIFGDRLAGRNCYSVATDNFEASLAGTRHLLEKGHRRIGLIWDKRNGALMDRLEGYRQGLEEKDITFDEALVRRCRYDPFDTEGGNPLAEVVDKLLSLPDPPTAIYALDDYMAKYTFDYCIERRIKVPRDLAILGFDDFLPSRLTRIGQDTEVLAEETVKMLLTLLRGEEPPRREVLVPGRFIQGIST